MARRPPKLALPILCENCAAVMQGDFCSQCGQSATDYNVPVTEFAKEFASETFSLDSRLRLTLKPLFFEPGAVPRDYVAGHRARFVPPIRLFVFASFAMFVIVTLGSGFEVDNITVNGVEVGAAAAETPDSIDAGADSTSAPPDSIAASPDSDTSGQDVDLGQSAFGQRMQDRFTPAMQRVSEDPRAFSRDYLDRFTQAMFFLLPVFAVLLKLVHISRLYVHHLVFSVYLHSFVFLVVALVNFPAAVRLSGLTEWMSLAVLGIPLYLLLGMKRFYGDGWVKTLAKFTFVCIAYAFVLSATMLGVFVISLLAI